MQTALLCRGRSSTRVMEISETSERRLLRSREHSAGLCHSNISGARRRSQFDSSTGTEAEACEWNSRCVIPMSSSMQEPHFGASAGGESPALQAVTRRAELAKSCTIAWPEADLPESTESNDKIAACTP